MAVSPTRPATMETAARTTIAAIATPPGTGALSLIRLSGPDSFAIADRANTRGLERASEAGIPTALVPREQSATLAEFSERIFEH